MNLTYRIAVLCIYLILIVHDLLQQHLLVDFPLQVSHYMTCGVQHTRITHLARSAAAHPCCCCRRDGVGSLVEAQLRSLQPFCVFTWPCNVTRAPPHMQRAFAGQHLGRCQVQAKILMLADQLIDDAAGMEHRCFSQLSVCPSLHCSIDVQIQQIVPTE